MLLKKTTILTITLFASIITMASTCPNDQRCYTNPEYEGYNFLAATAYETAYASYPGYASYPSNMMRHRAQKVCKFLGHKKAVFAKASDQYSWDQLLEVDNHGFAQVYASYYYYPFYSFEKLNCK